jgi:hypothetical protein
MMFQPEHNLVGVLTAAAREDREVSSFEAVRLCTDALALGGSVSDARLIDLGARKIFDRTSLNLAVWLPLSEQAGGAPAIWPNSPPIPVPGVEHLSGAQGKGCLAGSWVIEGHRSRNSRDASVPRETSAAPARCASA